RKLYSVKVVYERRRSHCKAQSCSGHGTGFAESSDDQQVVIAVCKTDRRPGAKIHICFVYEYYVVPIGVKDGAYVFRFKGQSRRRVGVGDDDHAVRVVIIRRTYGKIIRERYGYCPDPVTAGEHLVKTVADFREDCPAAAAGKGHKGEVEYIVGSVGHIYVFRFKQVAVGDRLFKPCAVRVRIESQ